MIYQCVSVGSAILLTCMDTAFGGKQVEEKKLNRLLTMGMYSVCNIQMPLLKEDNYHD